MELATRGVNLPKNVSRSYFAVMARASFILQAVTPANHANELIEMLKLAPTTWMLASVAYMREEGLAAVEAAIRPLADRALIFVGIRNDLTSVQAVTRLLGLSVQLYAVDTATRRTIYHPKLYIVANDSSARAIVGSANLTFGGMYNNIEVSTLIDLNLEDKDDAKFVNDIRKRFKDIIKDHPDHVFLIKDEAHIKKLFEEGRLADEKVVPAPNTSSGVKKGSRDGLKPMNLNLVTKPSTEAVVATYNKKPAAPVGVTAVSVASKAPTKILSTVPVLVWQSNELSERDLNVPSGTNTHKTGSMGFKKGAWDMDDFRHYFREEVFSDLAWKPKAPGSTIEQATAKFELIIKNLDYGLFELELVHNTNATSITYKQKNIMTHIKWGPAKPHIAKRDLLDRILYLYRKDSNPPEFVIEID